MERAWRNICAVRNVSDFKTVTSYRLIGRDQYEIVAPGGELKHGTLALIDEGTPVVAITLVLVALERLFHVGVFDPEDVALEKAERGAAVHSLPEPPGRE